MQEIQAYQTSDGQIFGDEDRALDHQTDIVGGLLDKLVADDNHGNITRVSRRAMLLNTLMDPELPQTIAALNTALQFGEWDSENVKRIVKKFAR